MNAIQDRTKEFHSAVSTFGRQLNLPKNTTPNNSQSIAKPASHFNSQASEIAKEIVHVTTRLNKLAQIAKRKEMLNDKSNEVLELTYVIKQEIFGIEKKLKDLSGRNTNSSNAQGTEIYNKNVINLLNTKTKNISENFKNVLEERQKQEMAKRERQEMFSKNFNKENVSYSMGNGGTSDNPFLAMAILEDTQEKEKLERQHDLLSLPQDQTQQLLLLEEQNQSYLQERNSAVEAIESTINEVGGLFQQLATMVQEQGEMIQRIDDNVEDVSLNISGAQRELMKYYNSISSNRWTMLKVFAMIIMFFLIWVLVS
ncbi:t-SNARE syntaxin [Martiniozyma asiatica (nom. inval.)]|nr:t-SNARE syntaxin [Martiniozyma asiatica]